MGQDGFGAQQAGVVVDVGVRVSRGEHGLYKLDLVSVFADVRLDSDAGFRCQLAEAGECLFLTRWGESGGDDWRDQGPGRVELLDVLDVLYRVGD